MLIENTFVKDDEKVMSNSSHRIFCIDCSGSMMGSIDLIRTQLKNKIAKLVQKEDYFTLVWFSGKGEFGTVFEHITVADLIDLSAIHQSIDKYLKTVGSTGFVEPIRLCKQLAEKYPEIAQIFFMSDGGENTWPQTDCENAFKELDGIPTVIVEYEYYCDRVLLKRLAEYSGGISIFNESFESFDKSVETYMKNRITKSRKFDTNLPILYFDESNVVVKNESPNGFINIPTHIDKVWQIDDRPFHFETDERDKTSDLVKQVYLTMIYALHTKSKSMMEHCVNILGDVYVSKLYSTCFSKQDYSNLSKHITNCVNEPETYAFLKGVDLTYKPNESFNIVELLKILEKDEKARFYPYLIKYTRISKEVKKDTAFVPNSSLGARFSLVSNQSRANISLGCLVHGHQIDEKDDVSPTTAYRNYTVLKDGIKNLTSLPFSFSEETFHRLVQENLIDKNTSYEKGKVYTLDLTDLPVVNREMVSTPFSSVEFCRNHIELYKTKAAMKYLKKMIELEKANNEEEKDEKKEEVDYSRSKKDPNVFRDFYMANELQVKISKCSTIPTINDKLLEKLTTGSKMTVSEAVLFDLHQNYRQVTENKMDWLDSKMKEYKEKLNELMSILEQSKIALLIGGVWFSDCSYDVNTFKVDGFEVTVEMNDSKVYMD